MTQISYGNLPKDHILRKLVEKHRIGNGRWFKAIKVGKYSFSIQASGTHYCRPKSVLNDVSEYASFEVLITHADGRNFRFKRSPLFRNFKHYGELTYSAGYGSVLGWLNADILNELYHYLLRAQGIEKERIYMPVKKDTLFWLLKGAGYVAVKISDFWDQRLMKYGELVKADKICFQNGYRKNAPVIEVQLKRIEMTETHYIFVLGETLFSNPLANDIAADIVFDMITRSIDAENAAENAVNT